MNKHVKNIYLFYLQKAYKIIDFQDPEANNPENVRDWAIIPALIGLNELNIQKAKSL